MKYLYIDFVSHLSHINFNRLHLEAIAKHGDVECIFRKGYANHMMNISISHIYEVPDCFYLLHGGGILNRIQYLLILYYIKFKINFREYERIIFSYYEEISLYLAAYPKGLILINHVNLSGLNSSVKTFFYKKVSKDNIQVVFNNNMRDLLQSKGVVNISVINHGIISPYEINEECTLDINFAQYSFVLFSPSSNSSDDEFLYNLIHNNEFKSYLKQNNLLFIIKSNILESDDSNIHIIKGYISDEYYRYIFVKSDIIVVSYPQSFMYRVSGVFFECIANKKNMILSEIDALTSYKDYFEVYPYYNSISTFMDCVDLYIKKNISLENYIYKTNFSPSYINILD